MEKIFYSIMMMFIISNGVFAQIDIEREDGGIWIVDGGRKIGFYQKDDLGTGKEKGRANYWHPLYLPDGTMITEDRPDDHPLHRGVFWAWHQVLINDRSIGDSWICKDIEVNVKDIDFQKTDRDKGQLETLSLWQSQLWENGKPFMEESTKYTFYTQKSNYNVIKIEITLKALADRVYLGGSDDSKGYGGFSVRMKLPDDVTFLSTEGKVTPMNDAVKAGQYMNITGTLTNDHQQGGIMIYADTNNQKDPQTWILRDKASMQNPVFPGRTPVPIIKDQPKKLTYYLVLYNGTIDPDKIIKDYGLSR